MRIYGVFFHRTPHGPYDVRLIVTVGFITDCLFSSVLITVTNVSNGCTYVPCYDLHQGHYITACDAHFERGADIILLQTANIQFAIFTLDVESKSL